MWENNRSEQALENIETELHAALELLPGDIQHPLTQTDRFRHVGTHSYLVTNIQGVIENWWKRASCRKRRGLIRRLSPGTICNWAVPKTK